MKRKKKGKTPKAIIVVHLYGMPAKMNELFEISEKFEIPIIEDAAEALGSGVQVKSKNLKVKSEEQKIKDSAKQEYIGDANSKFSILPGGRHVHNSEFRKCGSFGTFGILSFNGNKIITTSGGGALLSDNKEYIEKARFLATQARDDAPHYQHSHIGYNYRMSNVLAGIGRGQLKVIKKRVEQRRSNYEFYKKEFNDIEGIDFQPEIEGSFSNRRLTAITVNPNLTNGITREDIRLALEKENIEARPLWKPMHIQPVFKDAPSYVNGTSEKLFENGLCLPFGSNLTEEDLERIILIVKNKLNKK